MSLNPPDTAPATAPKASTAKTTAARWLEVAVAASCLCVVVVNLWDDAFARNVLLLALTGRADGVASELRALDQDIQALARGGSLLIRPAGFETSPGDAEAMLPRVYYRAVYTLYPRRAFIAEKSRVVNNGRDMATLNFNPGEAWLREHDVRAVLVLRREDNGQLSAQAVPVNPGEAGPGH